MKQTTRSLGGPFSTDQIDLQALQALQSLQACHISNDTPGDRTDGVPHVPRKQQESPKSGQWCASRRPPQP